MLPENKALLVIGTLYWVGLFVLIGGYAAAALAENPSLGSGGAAAGIALWIAAVIIGMRGRDRFGAVRTGVDRGR